MSRRRKAQSRTQSKVTFLNEQLRNNKMAIEDQKIKKKWTKLDLMSIKPLTPGQDELFHAWFNNQNICSYGSAGTGKTFVALYLALQEILDGRYDADHIIIVRSAVPTREVGFLPGTLEEKMSAYELPYADILEELIGRRSTYEDMKKADLITFMPTSFLRGLTWNNAIILIDEGENLNWKEINTVMTRVGKKSRIIFTGDLIQSDLPENGKDRTGMEKMLSILNDMENFACIEFKPYDIVRSGFCKDWIMAAEEYA